METVEGGGIVVLLISSLDSLTKLYTMTMDVHSRFRTESHQQARVRVRAVCGHALTAVSGDRTLQRALHLVFGGVPQLHLHGR